MCPKGTLLRCVCACVCACIDRANVNTFQVPGCACCVCVCQCLSCHMLYRVCVCAGWTARVNCTRTPATCNDQAVHNQCHFGLTKGVNLARYVNYNVCAPVAQLLIIAKWLSTALSECRITAMDTLHWPWNNAPNCNVDAPVCLEVCCYID